MNLSDFLARLGNLPFTYVFDPKMGCSNGSLRETTEVAIDFAKRAARPMYVRRGCGRLLAIVSPAGIIEAVS